MTDILTELRQYKSQLKNGNTSSQIASIPLFYAMIENLLMGKPSTDSLVSLEADYTVKVSDGVILVDATDANRTVTLPPCADVVSVTAGTSKIFLIKKTDAGGNSVTIVPDAADTIQGDPDLVLASPFQGVLLIPDGNDWYVAATTGSTGSGTGDVVGPATSTDEAIARYNGSSGELLQNSVVTIDDLGNIATPGTVDGRDLSVDGAKLDGIEAGADVTDATNVAAAGAVMDSDSAGGDVSGTFGALQVDAARGLRETSGPTVLTLGAVADGEYLIRSGSTIISAPASGGSTASISYIENFAVGRGYQHPSDVFSGLTSGTIVVLHMPTASVEGSPLRHICGTNGQFGGGVSLCMNGEHYTFRVYANGGSIRTGVSACPPTTRKWNMVVGRFDGTLSAGADLSLRLDINGGQVGGTYAAGVGGAPNSGVQFFVGARDGGVDSPALYDRVSGIGWVNRYVTDVQLAEWYAACRAAGQLVDIPSGGGLSGGWRVTGGADPGATWSAFAGATSLTRVGTALTPGEDTDPLWK